MIYIVVWLDYVGLTVFLRNLIRKLLSIYDFFNKKCNVILGYVSLF